MSNDPYLNLEPTERQQIQYVADSENPLSDVATLLLYLDSESLASASESTSKDSANSIS